MIKREFKLSMKQSAVALLLLILALVSAPFTVFAAEVTQETSPPDTPLVTSATTTAQDNAPQSPWLVLPTLSTNPKLGTSLGLLASYLHYFDKQSQVSMFGAYAVYTSTNSAIVAGFGKTSWSADHHRLMAIAIAGTIKNDYSDFLGTGKPLKSDDNLLAFASRYLYRVAGNWFAGVQGVLTNYEIIGQNALYQQELQTLGLTGFRSGGIGLAILHDNRDIEFSPTRGWYLDVNNIAYRDWIAGNNNFGVYRLDLKAFFEHWGGQVLALRQTDHWTVDAPPSAYAPVVLPGYKMGQYLGKNMASIEVEERLRFTKRWGASLFTGIACLYGNGKSCSKSENRYPDWGAGVQYFVKPKEGIVVNLEYAKGKSDNQGVYLKMGYGF
jgi:hypothetical protein